MKKILLEILKKIFWQIAIIIICIAINMYFLTFPSKITALIALVLRITWKYFMARTTRTLEKGLKDKLFEHFLKIKLTSIQDIKNGEIMSYFVKDIGEIRGLMYKILSGGTRIFFIFIIATYTMKNINTALTIATMCPIIITTYIIIILKKYVEESFKKSQKYFTNLSEYVQESTDAIRTTKAYAGETNQLKKFMKKNKILKKSNISVDLYSTLISTSINICFGFCYGITVIYGSKLVLNTTITLGDFVAFIGYIDLFYTPIYILPNIISKFKRAQISYYRLENVFKLEEETLEIDTSKNNKKISGDILIKNLSFNYPGNIDRVLDDISVEIKEGQTLGIIGTIGSGKTTLMNLLLRLYPVQDGKIFIGNQDINEIELSNLRKNISYITQDNFLFSTTIKENITLFKEYFTDTEILESTEKSIFLDEVKSMKNGLYTIIGERGIDLSGGQKQRVVISRAFLNKSNIIIFDDTFSALDNRTEKSLLANIKNLVKGKTCIIISNRISDVKDADKIVVFDKGKIVEEGTHKTLLKNKGLYNKFYTEQASMQEINILN